MQTFVERIESAILDFQQGKMIILTDHAERENEGDLILPAEKITVEQMNFIIRNSSGIVCLSLLDEQLKKLQLPLMVSAEENTSLRGTPFTISIDARNGITTGVSAFDRVQTILAAINDVTTAEDLVKPGHIFPLRARSGGVLERAGHTEGAIDLVRLAGFKPAAVLCEMMNADGTMMRGKELVEFARKHEINILSIDDIISYRLLHENFISEEVSARLPIQQYGEFKISVIKEKITGLEHLVLTKDTQEMTSPTLVRVHSTCMTGDLFGSLRCDCNQQLHYSLQRISESGGILIYLNQEGRGIGLLNKIKTYALQEQGFDTVEANQQLGLPVDAREYYLAANILRNRSINRVRLLTNNPDKLNKLKKFGITDIVMETIPIVSNEHNRRYLQVKKAKLHHHINV